MGLEPSSSQTDVASYIRVCPLAILENLLCHGSYSLQQFCTMSSLLRSCFWKFRMTGGHAWVKVARGIIALWFGGLAMTRSATGASGTRGSGGLVWLVPPACTACASLSALVIPLPEPPYHMVQDTTRPITVHGVRGCVRPRLGQYMAYVLGTAYGPTVARSS